MSRTRLWVSATIIAFVILITFASSVPHTSEIDMKLPIQSEIVSAPSVILHNSFKKGVHTISGSVEAANACSSVTASAALVSDASNVKNILVTISMSSDSGVCLQVPTQIDFKTTISAPADLPITATVNGVLASTTSS